MENRIHAYVTVLLAYVIGHVGQAAEAFRYGECVSHFPLAFHEIPPL